MSALTYFSGSKNDFRLQTNLNSQEQRAIHAEVFKCVIIFPGSVQLFWFQTQLLNSKKRQYIAKCQTSIDNSDEEQRFAIDILGR